MKINDLFTVKCSVNLNLNSLEIDIENGINFVSRTAKNNGITAKVSEIQGVEPQQAKILIDLMRYFWLQF